MKNFIASAVVFAALFSPSLAFADQNTSDRSAAIQLCRAEVTAQAGLDADSVRLDNVHLRASVVRVDFDVWRDGQLQNVRCEVSRGDTLQIASITPALGAVAAR
jgi:hypothetical protein